MAGRNMLGIILTNFQDSFIPELTTQRTFSSIPFGAKYRLIDFSLSNMVNSGISKIGVVTKNNYLSLMDHIGSGKAWNLSRRRGGLTFLPPFENTVDKYNTFIETMDSISNFIENAYEDYVLISSSMAVVNIDYQQMLNAHIKSNADITICYRKGSASKNSSFEKVVFSVDQNKRVSEVLINPRNLDMADCMINTCVIKKDLLFDIVSDCMSRSKFDFARDVVQPCVKQYKVYGYEIDGYCAEIDSIQSYFKANMDLLKGEVREELFNMRNPIYTKVRDDMPTKYGLNSSVKNSLISPGCVIEGEVENSIVFKGVTIAKGSKISNCIIMQDCRIGENTTLNYVICDKDVVVSPTRMLCGIDSYPVCISKMSVV